MVQGQIQDFRLDDPIDLDSSIKEIEDLRDALASMKIGLSVEVIPTWCATRKCPMTLTW